MPGAWDAQRPPDPALLEDCVHCGFCLPTCPTYQLWGEEMDSPRGRIALMSLGHEQPELSAPIITHLDRCLGCMACVTACPSGVQYDALLGQARAQIERRHRRPLGERAVRRLLFELFPHPGRLRALLPVVAAGQRFGLERLVPRRLPRLRAMAAMAPAVSLREGLTRLPAVTPARGERRGTVALLAGCVQRVFFSRVNRATVDVLAAEGFEVHVPRRSRCCGSLALHTGYEDEARARARETLAAFAGYETVLVNSAGCGSGMKEYAALLGEEPPFDVRDVHEFLAAVPARAPRGPLALRVAYHDACHLAHAQGIREQPRELLRGIPGLELLEPSEWELCCGSAGVYNLLEPVAAAELGQRKAQNLLGTGAEVIAAANPGCALQIARHLERPLEVVHPIELLARSLAGFNVR